MSSYSKYVGRFGGRKGKRYEIEISYPSREGEATGAQEVRLGAAPVVISYDSADKLDPIVQSRCAVQLWSDSDGKYQHLYSTNGRDVSLAVYTVDRGGARDELVWLGTIDPETYEEPYSRPEGYMVTLGFSDLGCLRRQKHKLSGLMGLYQIIRECLTATHPEREGLELSVSIESATMLASGIPAVHNTYIDTSLYLDDDGKPVSYWDVLGGILRSMRLRVEQRGGGYHVYDNSAMLGDVPTPLRSAGTDAVMMADRVYSSVEIETDAKHSRVTREIAPPSADGGEVDEVPRVDIDDVLAYDIKTKLISGGAYAVETKPISTGGDAKAVALYLNPSANQGVYTAALVGGKHARYSTISRGNSIDPDGTIHYDLDMSGHNGRRPQSNTWDILPLIPTRLVGYNPLLLLRCISLA